MLMAQNQNVEVRNAGGGNKEELVRNAAGQVVETRTVDANGKVRSRNTVDYQPGHYAPDTTTTSYYADGKSVENVVQGHLRSQRQLPERNGRAIPAIGQARQRTQDSSRSGDRRVSLLEVECRIAEVRPHRVPIGRRERREATAVETDHAGRSRQAVRGGAHGREGASRSPSA